MTTNTTAEVSEAMERAIIDAIEAQFDIHAMEPEDWAEMSSAIHRALAMQSERLKGDGEVERLREALDAIKELADADETFLCWKTANDALELSPPPDGASRQTKRGQHENQL